MLQTIYLTVVASCVVFHIVFQWNKDTSQWFGKQLLSVNLWNFQDLI